MERDVCHCFGVLAEAVLLTLRRAKMTLPGHCLSQSGQAVAHPGKKTGGTPVPLGHS